MKFYWLLITDYDSMFIVQYLQHIKPIVTSGRFLQVKATYYNPIVKNGYVTIGVAESTTTSKYCDTRLQFLLNYDPEHTYQVSRWLEGFDSIPSTTPPSSFYFWPKIQFSGNWWENRVVIACSSSLAINIIATAPSDNIFVNKSGGGIERSPMSRHKQGKMSKNV